MLHQILQHISSSEFIGSLNTCPLILMSRLLNQKTQTVNGQAGRDR
jgi:hypothetical protein